MCIKYRSSVLGRKYQMIYQYRNIMTLMYIFAHIYILRRKRRGIQPEGIQKRRDRKTAYRLASTAFIASAAELVIPPVYPEPSPIGYRFFIFTDSYFSLRLILTGEEVLVSAPNRIACSETNNGYSSFQLLNAFKRASDINSGNIPFISAAM